MDHVENYCSSIGIGEVTSEHVWVLSRPNSDLLFAHTKSSELEPHSGPISDVCFSPFEKKLLLTSSMDGSVKVFDIQHQRPLFVLFPPTPEVSSCALSSVTFSHGRPLVFACAAEAGRGNHSVHIYDLLESQKGPVAQIPLGGDVRGATCTRFNPKQRAILAVGDAHGTVKIFRLPTKLSNVEEKFPVENSRVFRETQGKKNEIQFFQ